MAVAAAFMSACGGTDPKPQGDTVKVGALLPFTGDSAAFGANLEESLLLATSLFNNTRLSDPTAGIAGKDIELVVRDTHSDLERGMRSARELVNEGVVAVIGTEHEALSKEMAPLLADNGILFVSPSVALVAGNTAGNTLIYKTAPSTTMLARALARRILDDGFTRVALLHSDDDFSVGFAALVASRIEYYFATVTANLAISQSEGARVLLSTMMGSKPDAVVLVTFAGQGAQVANEFLAPWNDSNVRWYFSPTLQTDAFSENLLAGGMEGMVGVGASFPPQKPGLDGLTLDDVFAGRWSGDVPTDAAYFYFDSMALVGFALQATAVAANGALPIAALKTNFEAVTRPVGVAINWTEVATGLKVQSEGRGIYFAGTTGDLTLDAFGERAAGTSEFWTIKNNRLVTAKSQTN
jgi:ABC-type branched-subunit amino acid transport system substrate-binding protein